MLCATVRRSLPRSPDAARIFEPTSTPGRDWTSDNASWADRLELLRSSIDSWEDSDTLFEPLLTSATLLLEWRLKQCHKSIEEVLVQVRSKECTTTERQPGDRARQAKAFNLYHRDNVQTHGHVDGPRKVARRPQTPSYLVRRGRRPILVHYRLISIAIFSYYSPRPHPFGEPAELEAQCVPSTSTTTASRLFDPTTPDSCHHDGRDDCLRRRPPEPLPPHHTPPVCHRPAAAHTRRPSQPRSAAARVGRVSLGRRQECGGHGDEG